jgi:hypothetical protein
LDAALLNDYSKEVDKKVKTLNTTSKAEHEAIGQTIQNVQNVVDDNNLSKSPIGTILAWVPKVQQNQLSVIELPSGN